MKFYFAYATKVHESLPEIEKRFTRLCLKEYTKNNDAFKAQKERKFMKSKLTSRFAVLGMLGLGAIVAVGHPVLAADGDGAKPEKKERPAGGRGGSPLLKALEGLDLSADQKDKLKPILKEYGEKSKALRDDTTSDRKAKMEKMKALMDETLGKIKPILTDEQNKQLEEALAKARAERGGRGGGNKPKADN